MKTKVVLSYDSLTNELNMECDNLPAGEAALFSLQRILLAAMNVVADRMEEKRLTMFQHFAPRVRA